MNTYDCINSKKIVDEKNYYINKKIKKNDMEYNKCNYCQKDFISKYNLSKHIKKSCLVYKNLEKYICEELIKLKEENKRLKEENIKLKELSNNVINSNNNLTNNGVINNITIIFDKNKIDKKEILETITNSFNSL
jgi:hypothetical protein